MNYLMGDTEQLITNDMLLCTAPNPSSSRSDQTPRSGTNTLSTIFLIVNATLGAGLLNFPQAFDKAGGLVTSISTQLLLLVFITAALVILANCSDVTNTSSMQDMFAEFYGQKSLILCAFCIIIYSFGCCLTFIIVVGDQFDRVLATYYGLDYCHTWYLSRSFVTAVTCSIFILPLCFFKRLDVLSYASSIGCVTVLYLVLLIIYKNITNAEPPVNPMKIWPDNDFEAPIVLYCGRDALLSLLGMDIDVSIRVRVLITLIWYLLTLIIAVLVPDISPVINLLGALSAVFIFIIPGISLFQSTLLKDSELYLNKDRLLIVFAVFIAALGAFISGVVFVEAIEDLNLTPKSTPLVTGFRQFRQNLCT